MRGKVDGNGDTTVVTKREITREVSLRKLPF